MTRGYRLAGRWVIHAVGPVLRGGERSEDEVLAGCYDSCLRLVAEHSVKTVAFPAISTGANRFPLDRATRIALARTAEFLGGNAAVE